jgi:hypothetical protein
VGGTKSPLRRVDDGGGGGGGMRGKCAGTGGGGGMTGAEVGGRSGGGGIVMDPVLVDKGRRVGGGPCGTLDLDCAMWRPS